MNVRLTWQKSAGITSQLVQYKQATASVWLDYGYVDLKDTSVTISNLADNVIYNFRVVTNCSTGSLGYSSIDSKINIICPTISTTSAASTITYSFLALKGSITKYTVKLFNNAGTTELFSQTPSFTSETTTITDTFSALTPNTSYKLQLFIDADISSKTCTQVSASTIAGTACDTPQSVSALIY